MNRGFTTNDTKEHEVSTTSWAGLRMITARTNASALMTAAFAGLHDLAGIYGLSIHLLVDDLA
jgi:hypothetical protein